MAAPKGKDAIHSGYIRGTQIENHAHIIGEFILMSGIEHTNLAVVGIAKCFSQFRRTNPETVLVSDRREDKFVED